MRLVAVITGTRAEYGLWKPVLERIEASPRLEGALVVTGMHLSPAFGMTVREIETDGFPIAARVDMLLQGDSMAAMGKSAGIGLYGLSQELERLQPEAVLILGDRLEAFAGAAAGLFSGAVVGHLHGGEVTEGGLDEYMRHAITKLSHLHFAATPKSRERILRLGEHPDCVFVTGTPGLDALMQYPALSRVDLSERLGMNVPETFLLIVQHPVSTHPETTGAEMNETLAACRATGLPAFLVYPNADAGHRGIIQAIQDQKESGWLTSFVTLRRPLFCNLLRQAKVLVGNSSSGMIDAPAYGTPVINIGERQKDRERGENVIDAPPERNAIAGALQKALHDEDFREQCRSTKNPYGDGHASERIVEILETADWDKARKCKRLPY